MNMNKKGVVVTPIVAILLAAGLIAAFDLAFIGGGAAADSFFGGYDQDILQDHSLGNSVKFLVDPDGGWPNNIGFLWRTETEYPQNEVIFVQTYFDSTLVYNVINNITLDDVGPYFVNTDVSPSNLVQPLNDSRCIVNQASQEYVCTFLIYQNSSRLFTSANVWTLNDIFGSDPDHAFTAYIHTTVKTERMSTLEQITSYYFTQSKIVIGLVVELIKIVYYGILITLGITLIGLLFLSLRKLYTWIKTGGKGDDNQR